MSNRSLIFVLVGACLLALLAVLGTAGMAALFYAARQIAPVSGRLDFTVPGSPNAATPNTETAPDLVLIIKAGPNGEIDAIEMTAGGNSRTVANLEELVRELNSLPQRNAPRSVRIRAGPKVRYNAVVETMDACLKCGFQDVGFGLSDPEETK